MTSHTLPRISTHVCSGHWAGLALNKKCSDEDCGHSSWLLSSVWWPGLLFLDWWELHDTADRIFNKGWEERGEEDNWDISQEETKYSRDRAELSRDDDDNNGERETIEPLIKFDGGQLLLNQASVRY